MSDAIRNRFLVREPLPSREEIAKPMDGDARERCIATAPVGRREDFDCVAACLKVSNRVDQPFDGRIVSRPWKRCYDNKNAHAAEKWPDVDSEAMRG